MPMKQTYTLDNHLFIRKQLHPVNLNDISYPARPGAQTVRNIMAYARALDVVKPKNGPVILLLGN